MQLNCIISIIFFISIFPWPLLGQNNLSKKVKISQKYTWRNSSPQKIDSIHFELPFIKESPYKTYIRISLQGHIIDLFSDDDSIFLGIQTTIIMEHKEVKESWGKSNKPYYYHFQKTKIPPAICTEVAQLLLQSGQDTIPTDSLIPNWDFNYLHCSTIIYEFKRGSNFFQKSYTCPWTQPDSVNFQKIISTNFDSVSSKLHLNDRTNNLISNQQKGKFYSRDGYRVSYLITKKGKKEKKNQQGHFLYMKSVSDTLNHFLTDTLTAIFRAQWGIPDYYPRLYIKISKKGNVKNITSKYKPDFLSERLAKYQYKKRIRKAFKSFNINFIRPEFDYYLHIDFSEKEGVNVEYYEKSYFY